MASIAQKKRLERLLRWKQDGVKALSEHGRKEQATRLLTAKLRAERLAREASVVSKPRASVRDNP
jgi:hypothetical protein